MTVPMSNAGRENALAAMPAAVAADGHPLRAVPPAETSPPGPERAARHESDGAFRSFFENAVEGIYRTTPEGRYLSVNPALARIYGFASPAALIEAFTDIGRQLYVDPQRREDFKRLMAESGIVQDFQAQVFRRDGSIIWITENARCVRDASGAVDHYEGTVQDITERKRIEGENRLLATVFDSVADGVLIVDSGSIVHAVNRALIAMTGFTAADLVGGLLALFSRGYQDRTFLSDLWAEVEARGRWHGEVLGARRDGTVFPASLDISAVRGESGRTQHYVVVCSDISQRKRDEERIRFQAHYDALTCLPNRHLIMDRLGQALLR